MKHDAMAEIGINIHFEEKGVSQEEIEKRMLSRLRKRKVPQKVIEKLAIELGTPEIQKAIQEEKEQQLVKQQKHEQALREQALAKRENDVRLREQAIASSNSIVIRTAYIPYSYLSATDKLKYRLGLYAYSRYVRKDMQWLD